MNTSDRGLNFITHFEGVRTVRYLDVAGKPTIGVGHLIKEGEAFNEPISMVMVKQLLKIDITEAELAVLKNVTVRLNQHHFDALVSFIFNVGAGAFKKSTLLKKLNAGDYDGAGEEFKRWDKAGGKKVAGLTRRRQYEASLFLSGSYGGIA